MTIIYISIFVVSCILIYLVSNFLIKVLARIARFLRWKEFVVVFFTMAFAGSVSNFFVGIDSALHKIPQLSFGDVIGGNVIHVTLAIALTVLIGKSSLSVRSHTVQVGIAFACFVAMLPLILFFDGTLGRTDGLMLILVFIGYIFWLFQKKERFQKIYHNNELPIVREFKIFIQDIGRVILGITLLFLFAEGIVKSAGFFANQLHLSLMMTGVLIVGLGNAWPEISFAIASAKKGQGEMALGNLMGNIIATATLVLGIVALICPIEIVDFSPFAVSRTFLFVSALLFFLFAWTDRKITKKEAIFLLGIYFLFVIVEIMYS